MNSDTPKSTIPTWLRYVLVITIAAVVGSLARLTNDIYIGTFLFNLDVQMPVPRWLESIGVGRLGIGAWWVFWLYWSEWLMAAILGVLIGIGLRNDWQVACVVCGIAVTLASDIFMLLSLPAEQLHYRAFDSWVYFSTFQWRIVSVLLMVFLAHLNSGSRDTTPKSRAEHP
jgi:hypothetical protein